MQTGYKEEEKLLIEGGRTTGQRKSNKYRSSKGALVGSIITKKNKAEFWNIPFGAKDAASVRTSSRCLILVCYWTYT